jgi:hypothetical protein
MESCSKKNVRCVNCSEHFQKLRPLITDTILSKHFLKDFPGFDHSVVIGCSQEHSAKLHKYERKIGENYIFRALVEGVHVTYAIDESHRLVFLRAFRNYKEYLRFLGDDASVIKAILSV